MVEAHPEDAVARLQQGHVDGRVGLRAGVRLHVDVLGAEDLLGAVDGELLGHVDELAAAVVALARIALGVLVREHRAARVEDRLRHEVLGGDHLERRLLAIGLVAEHLRDLGIDVGDRLREVVGAQLAHREDRSTASTRSRGTAPSRRSSKLPSPSKAVRSTTVDGRAGQLAGVEDEVDAGAHSGVDVLDSPRIGRPRSVGARLQDRPTDGGQGGEGAVERGDPHAEHLGPVGAGEREAAGRIRHQQSDPTRQQRLERGARARLELGQRRQGELDTEEHDRRGPVRPAPLDRVETMDSLRRVGLGGEAVDGVGRKQRHTADRDAALERLDFCRAQSHPPYVMHQIDVECAERPTVTRAKPARSG